MIMEIYHLTMIVHNKEWNLTNTAIEFNVSIGLVSENLRLAEAFHIDSKLMKCPTRQEALTKLVNGNGRYRHG